MTGAPAPDQPDWTGDRQAFWEAVWSKEDSRGFWSQADPEVVKLLAVTSPLERPDVLNLGCGLGRHAIVFAQAGYRVMAADVSEAAMAQVRHALRSWVWRSRPDWPGSTRTSSRRRPTAWYWQ